MSDGSAAALRTLPDARTDSAKRLRRRGRLCVVTTEVIGPHRNGGLGTADTGLAEYLAELGHDVTVLYCLIDSATLRPTVLDGTFESWQAYYRQHYGISLVALNMQPLVSGAVYFQARAYAIEQFLAAHAFDIVFVDDMQALAFYALQSRLTGTAHQNTEFVTTIHGPHIWVLDVNRMPYWSSQVTMLADLERFGIEHTDVLLGPSAYLLNYLQEHGVRLPDETYVQQYVLPHESVRPIEQRALEESGSISEIVFFGRLETRKGLALFCDVVDRLAPTHPDLTVTFMGRYQRVDGEHAGAYILGRAAHWPNPLRIVTTFGTPEAVSYLSHPRRLAMMTPLSDNSPCVVMEAIASGIPFVTTGAGGIGELIHPDDHARCVGGTTPDGLAALVRKAIEKRPAPARFAIPPEVVKGRLRGFVDRLLERPRQAGIASARNGVGAALGRRARSATAVPTVSVIVTHFNQVELLADQLAALARQTTADVEVIVVDDGSTDPVAIAGFQRLASAYAGPDWTFAVEPHGGPGAARNAAAKRARGAYVLFMASGSVALESLVSTLAEAAKTSGGDLISCFNYVSHDVVGQRPEDCTIESFPLGGASRASGLLSNVFADGDVLIRRDVFDRLGGYDETPGAPEEDWHLFARAALAGYTHYVVPRPLVTHYLRPEDRLRRANPTEGYRRVLSTYGREPLDQVRGAAELLLSSLSEGPRHAARWEYVQASANSDLQAELQRDPEDRPAAHDAICSLLIRMGRVNDALRYTLDNGLDDQALVGQVTKTLWEQHRAAVAQDAEILSEAVAALSSHGRAGEDFYRSIVPACIAPDQAYLLHLAEDDRIMVHPVWNRISRVLAPGGIPAGTQHVLADVYLGHEHAPAVEFALLALDPSERLHVLDDVQLEALLRAGEWSGWVRVPDRGRQLTVELALAEPTVRAKDLVLMTRVPDAGSVDYGHAFFTNVRRVGATRSTASRRPELTGHVFRPPVEVYRRFRDVSRAAESYTHATLIWDETLFRGVLIHPALDRPSVATCLRLLPATTRRVSARAFLNHAAAAPTEVAMLAGRWSVLDQVAEAGYDPVDGAPALEELFGPGLVGWSGWQLLSKPYVPVALSIPALDAASADDPLHLVLVSRIPSFSRIDNNLSVFSDIEVIWGQTIERLQLEGQVAARTGRRRERDGESGPSRGGVTRQTRRSEMATTPAAPKPARRRRSTAD